MTSRTTPHDRTARSGRFATSRAARIRPAIQPSEPPTRRRTAVALTVAATSSSDATIPITPASRAAASQPPTDQPEKAERDRQAAEDGSPRQAASRGRGPSGSDRTYCRSRQVSAATTIGRTKRTMPPRSRNVASASGQVAGVASVTSSAAAERHAPRLMAPGWPRARAPGATRSGGEDLQALERGLDQRDLVAVAGEVAVTQRGLGEREVQVRVVDEARARRPAAGRSRRGRGRRRSAGRGAGVAGVGVGRGVGPGDGLGASPASAASSRRSASPSESAPDDLARRGDDDPLELGERRAGRLQVDRLEVDERVAERHHDQAAADDVAARLVPERDLGADDRVLVDPRLDLGGPEDRRIGREAIDRACP